jgi:hypothetical protein
MGWFERREQTMEVEDVITQARDALTVKRCSATPISRTA